VTGIVGVRVRVRGTNFHGSQGGAG